MNLISRNYSLMKLEGNYKVNIEEVNVNDEKLLSLMDKFQLRSFRKYLNSRGLLCQ